MGIVINPLYLNGSTINPIFQKTNFRSEFGTQSNIQDGAFRESRQLLYPYNFYPQKVPL